MKKSIIEALSYILLYMLGLTKLILSNFRHMRRAACSCIGHDNDQQVPCDSRDYGASRSLLNDELSAAHTRDTLVSSLTVTWFTVHFHHSPYYHREPAGRCHVRYSCRQLSACVWSLIRLVSLSQAYIIECSLKLQLSTFSSLFCHNKLSRVIQEPLIVQD
jgi:hypothetical protein